jgi:hypothetical protein
MMDFGYEDLVNQLRSTTHPSGGWRGRTARPSITVTSEALLALFEHLETIPFPTDHAQKEEYEQLNRSIDEAASFILTETGTRRDEELDPPNHALSLAAYCGYRAHVTRMGGDPGVVRSEFVHKALRALSKLLLSEFASETGPCWAVIKGIDNVWRTYLEGKDHALVAVLADSSAPSIAMVQATTDVLKMQVFGMTTTRTIDAYSSAIVLEMCITTLLLSPAKHVDLPLVQRVQRSCISTIETALRGHRASRPFPYALFNANLRPGEYRVVIKASLLYSFGVLIERPEFLYDLADQENIQLWFYSLADFVRNEKPAGGRPSFEAAHCLRAITQVHINERDLTAVMTLMRERERRRNLTPDAERMAEVFIARPPVLFGSIEKEFICGSARLYFGCLVGLVVLLYAVANMVLLGHLRYAYTACCIGLFALTLPISFSAWARAQNYSAKSKDQKWALIPHYIFTGAIASLAAMSVLLGWSDRIFRNIGLLP